ncbi:hypothetical protein LXA43DRAFT_1029909 [Ganoderma leucocontextum]|nr:hypothetical protein LXA43DRAFT_1029909 [Ganoderma leucocontextum]
MAQHFCILMPHWLFVRDLACDIPGHTAMYYTNPIRSATGPPSSSTFRTSSTSTSSYARSSSPTRSTTRSSTPPQANEFNFEDISDVLVTVFRPLSRWTMPDIEGICTFGGELHHTAGYRPSGATWKGDLGRWGAKRVSVIGAMGAFAVRARANESRAAGDSAHAAYPEAGELRVRADVAVAHTVHCL